MTHKHPHSKHAAPPPPPPPHLPAGAPPEDPETPARDMDRAEVQFPKEFLQEAGRRNLLGPRYPVALGGRGLHWVDSCMAMEEVGVLSVDKPQVSYTQNGTQGDLLINQKDDTLSVGDRLVIQWDIQLMRKVAGMMAGGLFNVKLAGKGLVAITTHYDPLTLRVTPQSPVSTDPNATVVEIVEAFADRATSSRSLFVSNCLVRGSPRASTSVRRPAASRAGPSVPPGSCRGWARLT